MPGPEITDEQAAVSFDTEDEFNRKPVAEKLIQLLTSDIDVSPMVIDGGWGAGKTRFCEKTIKLFNETHPECRCIYVDAFKADHADEPLMTLLAAVAEDLPKSKQKQLIKKALPAARFALKTGLKAGVGWVLRQNADQVADDFEKDVESAGKAAVDASIESLLNDHIEAKKSIETLREALEKLAEKQPIVIFVDELDRCRPDFAVSMLENIKHIFDVDHVEFVLIANGKQLRAAIEHRYGSLVDSENYLEKFVNFSFSLPDVEGEYVQQLIPVSIRYFDQLVEQDESLKEAIPEDEIVRRLCHELISTNHLSLRSVEKFVRYLGIANVMAKHGFGKGWKLSNRVLRIFAVYIFCFDRDLAIDISRNQFSADAIRKHLQMRQVFEQGQSDRPGISVIAAHMILAGIRGRDFPAFTSSTAEDRWKQVFDSHFEAEAGAENNWDIRPTFLRIFHTLSFGELK